MAAKKPKVESGGARMKRTGKRPILLGVTDEQYKDIEAAAYMEGRQKTQFIVHHIWNLAKIKLGKSEKSTK